MENNPDYIVDIEGVQLPRSGADQPSSFTGRPWLAIQWKCCSTYSRIYRNHDATAYEGRCPKCQRAVRVPIGEGGTDNRFFVAE